MNDGPTPFRAWDMKAHTLTTARASSTGISQHCLPNLTRLAIVCEKLTAVVLPIGFLDAIIYLHNGLLLGGGQCQRL